VFKLLLEALRLQQLGQLPGALQLSSNQARELVLAALHWGCYGAFKALVRVIDLLHPQHLLQLLKRAALIATLGSCIELQEPWCDERMRAYGIKFPESPWKEGYMVVRLLRSARAAGDIPRAGVHELLLTAAALGNGDVLAMLWNGGMAARARDSDLAAEMLQCAVQFRDSHMLSCVEACVGTLLRDADYEELTELAVGLVRTDEGTALAHLVNGVAKWLPQYVRDDLPELLQLAVRLGRSKAIRAVNNNHHQLRAYTPSKRVNQGVTLSELEELLQLAVRGNSSGSMVRALLLLPGAAALPGGGLQLVME
jgi:hypothetical protein